MPKTYSLTKIYIEQALFKMLEEKNPSEISITELVDVAGVSRNSFYRNFVTIDDVAVSYYDREFKKWRKEQSNIDYYSSEYKKNILLFFNDHKDKLNIIYQRNYFGPFFEYIRSFFTELPESDTKKGQYRNAILSGQLIGILTIWVENGMKETPEELVELLKQISFEINK